MEHHLAKVGAAGSNPVSRFDIEKISKKIKIVLAKFKKVEYTIPVSAIDIPR